MLGIHGRQAEKDLIGGFTEYNGSISAKNAKELDRFVDDSSFARSKKMGYLSFKMHQKGKELEAKLQCALVTRGAVRQYDAPPPKPVILDLQKWLVSQRSAELYAIRCPWRECRCESEKT